jgi:hypothetical protein
MILDNKVYIVFLEIGFSGSPARRFAMAGGAAKYSTRGEAGL